MTSEIIKEMEENIKKIESLISKQMFSVKDAQHLLTRYFNIYRKMEQLEKSRDNWKSKYLELKRI